MPFSFQPYRRARERDIVIILRTVKNQKTEHGVRLALFMQPAGPVCSAARCPRSANTRKTAGSFRRTFCCRHGEPYRSGKTPLCRTVQKPCSHHAAPHAFQPPSTCRSSAKNTKMGNGMNPLPTSFASRNALMSLPPLLRRIRLLSARSARPEKGLILPAHECAKATCPRKSSWRRSFSS